MTNLADLNRSVQALQEVVNTLATTVLAMADREPLDRLYQAISRLERSTISHEGSVKLLISEVGEMVRTIRSVLQG